MEDILLSQLPVIKVDPMLLMVPLLPLIGSLLVYFLTNRDKESHRLSGWIATVVALCSFAVSLKLFCALRNEQIEAITASAWQWFAVGNLDISLAFRLDKLSAVMLLIITGVGSLIHLYAIGYMAHDDHRPRFFSYLNLFLFAMLVLVLGDNLLLMFVGWEGVGLCSYLLIGFWFKEMPNAQAGQKAFVVNRIGDAGFLLGMFVLFVACGTLNFEGLRESMPQLATNISFLSYKMTLIDLAALLLFIGAIGKSAQIPLYIWLPDAMAGPTPVSALIHAATMVTAGVYMIARMSFLYVLSPNTLAVVLVIGTATAFLAASIALVQQDIKRVLAYSTVSQLGYMFMAMGAGAFSNGIYHVVTHAFFKACLFMAAGSVIIGCHHVQDMREYGGLWKSMKITCLTYFVATLAIAGFPYLSGFYSKDAILWAVYSSDKINQVIPYLNIQLTHFCWGVGLLTAVLTAFYMTRSLMLTFFSGPYRGHEHPHESPWVVCLPLIILAALSAVFGAFYGDPLIHFLEDWTRGDLLGGHHALAGNHLAHQLELISIAAALSGIALAVILYWRPTNAILRFFTQARGLRQIYNLLFGKWWIDELYAAIVVKPLTLVSQFLFAVIDRGVIDALVNGLGIFVEANGEIARKIQVGRISAYALLMCFSSFFFVLFWLVF